MNEDVDILPYKRFNEKTTFNKKDYSESFDLSIAFNMLFNQNFIILVKRNQHSQEFATSSQKLRFCSRRKSFAFPSWIAHERGVPREVWIHWTFLQSKIS
jgi:hypothetical protein